MKSIILTILIILSLGTFWTTETQAQAGWGLKDATTAESVFMPEPGEAAAGTTVTDSVAYIINEATDALTVVVAAVAIFFTIINGFLMATSAGSDNLAKAKKGLLWSIGGLILVILAYIITKTTVSLVYT